MIRIMKIYEIKPFKEIIQVVQDLNRIDIDKLQDLAAWFDDLLHPYQHMTTIQINVFISYVFC